MSWTNGKNMYDFYEAVWRPFGSVLTDMEMKGIFVDKQMLKESVPVAEAAMVCFAEN